MGDSEPTTSLPKPLYFQLQISQVWFLLCLWAYIKRTAAMDYVAQPLKEWKTYNPPHVAAPAWRSLPSSVSNDSFQYANTSTSFTQKGEGGRGRRLCTRINRDLHTGTCGLMLRLFPGFDKLVAWKQKLDTFLVSLITSRTASTRHQVRFFFFFKRTN